MAKQKTKNTKVTESLIEELLDGDGKYGMKSPVTEPSITVVHSEQKSSPIYDQLVASNTAQVYQKRIKELEIALGEAFKTNETLASSAKVWENQCRKLEAEFKRFSENRKAEKETDEIGRQAIEEDLRQKEEKVQSLEFENEQLRLQNEGGFRQIRARERELEHRLQLARLENQALIHTKDQMILELKRQIDHFQLENDKIKKRNYDLSEKFDQKQDVLQKAVRALRVAVSILEGADGQARISKKV